MGALIDTSILIAAERGQLDLTALLTEYVGERFGNYIQSLTQAEFIYLSHLLPAFLVDNVVDG